MLVIIAIIISLFFPPRRLSLAAYFVYLILTGKKRRYRVFLHGISYLIAAIFVKCNNSRFISLKTPAVFYLRFAFLYSIIVKYSVLLPNILFRFRKAEGGDNIAYVLLNQ